MDRVALFRKFETIPNAFNAHDGGVADGVDTSIRVKRAFLPGGQQVTVKPEFEDCARVARATGLSLKTVQQAALDACGGSDGSGNRKTYGGLFKL